MHHDTMIGRNLLCIHSKKHIKNPPEDLQRKQAQNMESMKAMSELVRAGGKCFWVAPSGGRDRPNSETHAFEVAPFDFKVLGMFTYMSIIPLMLLFLMTMTNIIRITNPNSFSVSFHRIYVYMRSSPSIPSLSPSFIIIPHCRYVQTARNANQHGHGILPYGHVYSSPRASTQHRLGRVR